MTAPSLTPDQRKALIAAARLECAYRSTIDAVRWRDPKFAPMKWQRDLGLVESSINKWTEIQRQWKNLHPIFIGTAEGRVPCRTPLQVVRPGAFRKV